MIYEQLSDYCDCIKSFKEEDVDELINLVSVATCWTQQPCETFLNSERREVVRLDDCLCDCEIVRFKPYYTPFDVESFTFTLVKEVGIEEEFIPITEFNYSEVEGVFKIDPPIPNCKCGCNECSCNPTYKLVVDYTAGYEDLPDCLLPIFCEALQYIIERRSCDCTQCQTCENDYDDDKVEVLVDNAATITNQLKKYFVETLAEQYKRQLSLISLCRHRRTIWGIVV